jgi:hypothetical protein
VAPELHDAAVIENDAEVDDQVAREGVAQAVEAHRFEAGRRGAALKRTTLDFNRIAKAETGDLGAAGSADRALGQRRGEGGRCDCNPDAPDHGDPGAVGDGLVEQ